MQVGYARTSTTGQDAGLEAQLRDLTGAGCEKLFQEQVSSFSERQALAGCLAFLREGDVLYVTKPDRLARSTAELLSIEGTYRSAVPASWCSAWAARSWTPVIRPAS